MTKHAELTVLQWTYWVPNAIQKAGFDPKDRLHYTGHTHHLLTRYVDSIGLWGGRNTKDLINTHQPRLGILRLRPGTYRQFRNRHGLYTLTEFMRIHGDEPWMRAEASYLVHKQKQRELRQESKDVQISIGATIAAHCEEMRGEPNRLGLLPVETVVWCRVFHDFLGAHYLTYHEWARFTDAEKSHFWTEDWDEPYFHGLCAGPAFRHLPATERELATG